MELSNKLTSGFARRDVQRELTIAPQHRDSDAVADASVGEQALQVVDRCDRRVAEGDDDVPLAHARGGGGRAFFHRADPDAGLVRKREVAHHAAPDRRVLTAHADIGTPNASFPDQRDGNALRGVRGYCEANSLSGKNHRRVHADNAACGVDQRSAGITRIERRVGLDDVVEQASGLSSHRPTQRADDACGDGVLKSVRTADGDRDLPDAQLGRVGKPDVRKACRSNLDDRQIGVRIVAHQLRSRNATVRQRDLQDTRTAGDVAVAYHVSVRRDDESRARACLCAAAARTAFDADVGDRGSDLGDNAGNRVGISIEHVCVSRPRILARRHSRARIVGDGERQRDKPVAGRSHRLQDGGPRRRFQALARRWILRPARPRYTAAVALRSVSSERRPFTARYGYGGYDQAYIMRINAILTSVVLLLSLATFPSAAVAATTVVNVLLEDPSSDPAIGNMRISLAHATVTAGRVTFHAMNRSKNLIHEVIVVRVDPKKPGLSYDEKKTEVIEKKIQHLGEISELKPGAAGAMTLSLKPGSYVLICNQPGHYKAGMVANLSVNK